LTTQFVADLVPENPVDPGFQRGLAAELAVPKGTERSEQRLLDDVFSLNDQASITGEGLQLGPQFRERARQRFIIHHANPGAGASRNRRGKIL
jgi:hypothetical protein